MQQALARWWVRILLTLLVVAALVAVMAVLPEAWMGSTVGPLIFYAPLTMLMVGIERMRKGGAMVCAGLPLRHTIGRELFSGTSIAILMLIVVAVVAWFLGASWTTVGTGSFPFVMFVIAAAGEEILFRGTIFQALEEHFGSIAAVSTTSLLFGVAHLANDGADLLAVVNVSLAGILLGTMASVTRSLWPGIAFHIVWNVLVACCFGAVSGSSADGAIVVMDVSHVAPSLQWLVTGTFGIEHGLVTTLLLAIATWMVARRLPWNPYVAAARARRRFAEQAMTIEQQSPSTT